MSVHFLLDLKELYPNWQSFVNGCAVIVNGGSGDKELYQRIVDFAGDKVVMRKSVGKDNTSEHESFMPFLTVKQLDAMPADECVVKVGRHIIKLKKPYEVKGRPGKTWMRYYP
jgi:hypothetical protein